VRGRGPMRAIFTPKKALSKNNRYYAIVDRYSNITVIKHCYHENLYLNGPWLHERVYQMYQAIFVHIIISQIYILKFCVTIYRRIITTIRVS